MADETPLIYDSCKDLLLEVKQHFKIAEDYIKYALAVLGDESGVGVPAINELRYAGQHLLEALYDTQEEQQHSSLKKALNHCHRSSYDAMEAGCMKLVELIDAFYRDYEDTIVADDIPGYAGLKANVREIRNFIVNHTREDAPEYWASLKTHFDTLNSIFVQFDEARPEINKRKQTATASVARDERKISISKHMLLGAGIGALVTTVVAVLTSSA